MPISYSFKCPNGHEFNAVAKLRARCPECGQTTRRNFLATPITSSGPEKHLKSSSSSSDKEDQKKTSERGSTLVSNLKKVTKSEPETKSSSVSSQSAKKSPRVIRQGMMPRPIKQTTAKPPVKPKAAVKTNAPVNRRRVVVGSHPSVSKMPVGSKERKTTKRLAEAQGDIPFWEKVKRQYFR